MMVFACRVVTRSAADRLGNRLLLNSTRERVKPQSGEANERTHRKPMQLAIAYHRSSHVHAHCVTPTAALYALRVHPLVGLC